MKIRTSISWVALCGGVLLWMGSDHRRWVTRWATLDTGNSSEVRIQPVTVQWMTLYGRIDSWSLEIDWDDVAEDSDLSGVKIVGWVLAGAASHLVLPWIGASLLQLGRVMRFGEWEMPLLLFWMGVGLLCAVSEQLRRRGTVLPSAGDSGERQ